MEQDPEDAEVLFRKVWSPQREARLKGLLHGSSGCCKIGCWLGESIRSPFRWLHSGTLLHAVEITTEPSTEPHMQTLN